MSSVIRLTGGSAIQVRTGVVQGVGPAGPTGPVGPPGPEGPVGPAGPVGPLGQIMQVQAEFSVSGTQDVASGVNTDILFPTVAYDDMSAHTSNSTFTLADPGDYLINAWIQFDVCATPPAAGHRSLWVAHGTVTAARVDAVSRASAPVCAQVFANIRTTAANETISIRANSSDPHPVNLGDGRVTITRVGSGPIGAPGPEGPEGPEGPVGPAGPAGPVGPGSGPFTTYQDLY